MPLNSEIRDQGIHNNIFIEKIKAGYRTHHLRFLNYKQEPETTTFELML